MTPQLANALKELSVLKAKGVPNAGAIEKADNKSTWDGELKDGGTWKLIKHSPTSYTTNTRNK